MVKNTREKNKIRKKERKGFGVCVVPNLARVVRGGTHQLTFEQRSQRIKGTHSVHTWRKNILGRGKSERKGPEAIVYLP